MELCFDYRHRYGQEFPSWNDYEVQAPRVWRPARLDRPVAKDLSEAAFCAIARHGAAKAARRDDAKPIASSVIGTA